jgi:hypothetical protein
VDGVRTDDNPTTSGVSRLTVFGASDARKLRALEDENRRLKTLVADLTLDNQMLKAVVSRKWWTPMARRQVVGSLQDGFGVSQRRARDDEDRSTSRYGPVGRAETRGRCL